MYLCEKINIFDNSAENGDILSILSGSPFVGSDARSHLKVKIEKNYKEKILVFDRGINDFKMLFTQI